jgi:hypothetical protein
MEYNFWEILPGLAIMGALFVGIFGAIFAQLIVALASGLLFLLGSSSDFKIEKEGRTMTIKENFYDYDEDN